MNVEELKQKIESTEDVFILDVREKSEYDEGHIKNSEHIPLSLLEEAEIMAAQDDLIVVYCRTDSRSEVGKKILNELGFLNVENLDGGILDWKKAGYELEK